MTRCVNGPWSHDFPMEDATGAYCPQHGVTLLFDQPEYLDDDLVCPEPPTTGAAAQPNEAGG